ncbi:MAG TPA: class I SAM-dependent methyltransferase [Actinomycetota bacterium]|nr:class I SAM-dependent methyltransferase [Actinomycetota bacterium]
MVATSPPDLEGLDPKAANVVYHDAAARSYEAKWAISFDERCIGYVRERAERMLPARRYGKVLEVGAGTGFFILNLWQAGFVEEAHATDIAPGMIEALRENGRQLGCDVRARPADAEGLPYPDGSFDLVVGHAFLHHLPEPRVFLAEAFRVLRPGGAILVAGEPTVVGDRMARIAGRLAGGAFRLAGRVRPGMVREPAEPATDDERVLRDLEFAVDLHTFEPDTMARWANAAGFSAVRVETEELLSALFGWSVRTIEAEARPGLLGRRWAWFAYRNYLRLYRVDRKVLARLVSRRLFYNLLLYGERPGG